MPLRECPDCASMISTDASSCPQCGSNNLPRYSGGKPILNKHVFVAGLIVLLVGAPLIGIVLFALSPSIPSLIIVVILFLILFWQAQSILQRLLARVW